MPFNEFSCSCGNEFQIMVRRSLDQTECPGCGTQASRKLSPMSSPVFSNRTGNEDIDVLVGSDASSQHLFNEERKKMRDAARLELNSERLSVSRSGKMTALTGDTLEKRRSLAGEYQKAVTEDRVTDLSDPGKTVR